MRGARIYWVHRGPALYVNVNVLGRAFAVQMQFIRHAKVTVPFWLKPEGMADLGGYATTWNIGSVAVHDGDASFILSAIAKDTDEFIDEYLRVNADACEKRPSAR